MKPFPLLFFFVVLFFLLLFSGCDTSFPLSVPAKNFTLRPTAVQGSFYPATPEAVKKTMQQLLDAVAIPSENLWGSYAFVLPHAGWQYAGKTMAFAWKTLDHFMPFMPENLTFLILAPSHYQAFAGVSLVHADGYQTPFGFLPIAKQSPLLKAMENASLLHSLPEAHEKEHSIEVQLPWLNFLCKKHKKQCSILPLLLGSQTSYDDLLTLGDLMVSAYGEQLGNDVFLLVSTDFTHYGKGYGYVPFSASSPEQVLQQLFQLNHEAYQALASNHPARFLRYLQTTKNTICGRGPLLVLMQITKSLGGEWILLHNVSSYAITNNLQQIVYYASFAVRGEKEGIIKTQEKHLLQLARKSIQQQFTHEAIEEQLPYSFFQKRGCFVTLEKQGQLRGCIGDLLPEKQLWQCVMENAKRAAFDDPRFPPLKEEELPAVTVEISLLTKPQSLQYNSTSSLFNAINHSMGIVLRYGWKQATFLPQVWEQLPQKEAFFTALCKKANAPADCWHYHPEIYWYMDSIIQEEEKDS